MAGGYKLSFVRCILSGDLMHSMATSYCIVYLKFPKILCNHTCGVHNTNYTSITWNNELG